MAGQELLVLYGSETGNAEEVAERIGREGNRRHFRVRVLALDAISPEHLASCSDGVIVVSTAGQGEAPASMRTFWPSLLRKSLPTSLLSNLSFALFGLGDSAYPRFNVAAKRLRKRLLQLSASELLPIGLGDDQHASGFHSALDPWLSSLWHSLRLKHPLPPSLHDPPPVSEGCMPPLDPPKLRVSRCGRCSRAESRRSRRSERLRASFVLDRVNQACNGIIPPSQTDSSIQSGVHSVHSAPLFRNCRLTSPSHWQDVRHISLDISQLPRSSIKHSHHKESEAPYEPGDLAAIMPEQAEDDVNAFLLRTSLDADELVLLAPSDNATVMLNGEASRLQHEPIRVEDLVAGCLDINGASPKRYFFEVLSHFAQSDIEQERLQFFASAEGREDLQLYNSREMRTVSEILYDFSTATPHLEYLLQIVPRLRERYFSISSSPRMHPNELHCTVAVVDCTTPYGRRRKGLCSSWLASLPDNGSASIPIWLDRGALKLPSDDHEALFVGPGTGVAPFRSMVHERSARKGLNDHVKPTTLVFGCRSREGDYMYADEWAAQQDKTGSLEPPGGLVVAFSRDEERRRVNHALIDEAERVWRTLRNGGCVYVSGRAGQMPRDVQDALEAIACEEGGLDNAAAKAFLKRCENGGLLAFETWS